MIFQYATCRAVSFDCSKTSGLSEAAVCRDQYLSQLDDKLSAAYSAAQAQSGNSSKPLYEQQAWVGRRNQCETATCLSEADSARVSELDSGLKAIPTKTTEQVRQTEYATAAPPVMTGTLPAIQQPNTAAPAPLDDTMRKAFRVACSNPIPLDDIVRPWFSRHLIRNLEDAVLARRDALKTGKDPLSEAIQDTQKAISRMENEGLKNRGRGVPADPRLTLAEECFSRYLAYLESVDAPSWDIARKAAEQESGARVEQQRQALESQERAADEVAAEQARQRKEAALVDESRQRHEAAAAVARRQEAEEEAAATQKRQEEATAKEESERPAREAAAKIAQNAEEAARREAEKLPACADVAILKSVKEIVAASPAGVTDGLRISGLEEIRSVRLDTEPAKRFCSAKIMTTAGTMNGVYTIKWTEAHDNVWIEILGLD
jgi:uncharacterized protein